MKIYFASQSFYPYIGGVPTYLFNLILRLKKMGNEVLEIHLRTPGKSDEEEIDGIEIHRVPREPIDEGLLEGYSEFKESFQKAILGEESGFTDNVMEMEGYREFYDINQSFGEEVSALLETHPAEIVHVHDFQLVFLYKYVPRGTPLVLTWHGPFLSTFKDEVKEFVVDNMKEYDKVIFASEKYKESAVKAGLLEEKAEVICPIANTDLFKPLKVNRNKIKAEYDVPKDSKMILCVQRVDWRSSHEQLIKAMSKIIEEVPDAVLVFVGGKSMSSKISESRDIYREDINELIKKLGLSNHVILTENIDYFKLPPLYNTADVVASTPKMETFGLSVTEGMSCGKPIIGTDVGGIPIQVKNGVNGFLVEVNDIEDTAKKIIRLLQEGNLREKMGKESIRIVEEEFQINKGIEKHAKLYGNLLKEKSDLWSLAMMNLDNVEAVITDFDRTITDKLGRINPKVIKKLKSLKKSLILVTGRKLPYTKKLYENYPIWNCIIAENGAIIYFPKTNKEITIDSEYMKDAREIIENSEVKVFYGKIVISSDVKNKRRLREILKPINRNLNYETNVNEIMILPKNTDKGRSTLIALHELEIDPKKTIIIGDSKNDLKLFNVPGYRVAVANADKRLKSIADEVTKKECGEGVMEVIDKLKK